MSYRTYILEKELAEVKAKLELTTQIFAEVVHHTYRKTDPNFDINEYVEGGYGTLPDDVLITFRAWCASYADAENDEYDRLERLEYEEEEHILKHDID